MAADLALDADPETWTTRGRRVLLVAMLDGFANGTRPTAIDGFLREHGHRVQFFNSYYLSRASGDKGSLLNKLPHLGLRRLALYVVESAAVLARSSAFGRRHLTYGLLAADYRLRRSILGSLLPLDEFDLVMCAHPQDAGLLTTTTSAFTFYDLPTPYADELAGEGKLTRRQHARLRRSETRLLESVDGLSFNWDSYRTYTLEHYKISGRNVTQLNWGCQPAAERARFSSPPRIIYLGSLSSRFIDLPLLSRLSQLNPNIDIYGGPAPDPALGLNYRGWAAPTVLQDYQFGLITCSKDELRRDGFSAKHLDYIAYGLPVLVPSWRRRLDLLRGSLPYDESTFRSVVEEHSTEEAWQRASDEAYTQAQALTWEKTLSPLDALLRGLPGRAPARR